MTDQPLIDHAKRIAAKVKRLAGETCTGGPKHKLKSRPFDKSKTRKFGGKVIERKPHPIESVIPDLTDHAYPVDTYSHLY